MPDRPAAFAALFGAALAAHQLADHVLGQTDGQAGAKASPGWEGWQALAAHVGQYHLVMAGMVGLTVRMTGIPVSARGLAVGLAVSAVTHGLWDRRRPVRWILQHTGGRNFAGLADHGMNGMYLSDQALHVACLWAAALAAVTVGGVSEVGRPAAV